MPEQAEQQDSESVGRLTSLYYKILSFQSEPLDMAFSSNPPGRPAAIQADHPQSIEPSAPSPLNGQLLEAANMNMGIDQENGVYNNEMDMWLYDDIWNF